ncbi:DUF4129 domain-containing protein [Actinocrinis puniceicyclus]|uniref:DUF4129 domain-containing protein n=1 Tax=Actinocrinis puniceicyclus TaxID=977794 RepID=A0A8J7WKP5_9ACTN|nr:DUF4129 domain-containing protein [Actinocrinis puniceicyclus]MBS2964076.1 DUF4129 domain-containing protein [Actinocrinis puniceicyclus]
MRRSGSGDQRLIPRDGRLLAAATVLALGVAAIGVRAAAGAALRSNDGLPTGAAVGLALLFAGAALVTAAKYRLHVRTTEVPSNALDRLRQATVAVLFAGAVLVPFALILLRRPDDGKGVPPFQATPTPTFLPGSASPGPARSGATRHPVRSFSFDLSGFLVAFAIVIGVALLVLLVLLAARLLRGLPLTGPVQSSPPAAVSGGEDEALADALLAGRGALDGEDARTAIIACYAAMEESLAQAGVARKRADSPFDLLRRAASRELPGAGTRDAVTLTELFREARFSSHPMTARHLETARRALDSVTDALAERTEPGSGDAPRTDTHTQTRVVS